MILYIKNWTKSNFVYYINCCYILRVYFCLWERPCWYLSQQLRT